jgi:hypothetical protein
MTWGFWYAVVGGCGDPGATRHGRDMIMNRGEFYGNGIDASI